MPITSKFTALAAASAIAVASIFPVSAFAQNAGSIPNSSGSAEASEMIEPGAGIDQGTTGSIAPASSITVKRIDALENDEARQFENLSQDQLAAAQQELQANPGLVSELQAKGVQLNNVVDVQTFGNGGVLVYVR
jgi:hypothetical protein